MGRGHAVTRVIGGLIVCLVVLAGATAFGMNVPAEQIMSQVGAVVGQDPSSINVGFMVDRLFTCNGVVIIDGRVARPFDS